jgi:hypothetical protein
MDTNLDSLGQHFGFSRIGCGGVDDSPKRCRISRGFLAFAVQLKACDENRGGWSRVNQFLMGIYPHFHAQSEMPPCPIALGLLRKTVKRVFWSPYA